MSSYIKKVKNPKTGKMVKAFFIDDFYGSHRYGIGFRKDGKDAKLDDLNSSLKDCEFYPLEKIIK
jgi:hypothetical protein